MYDAQLIVLIIGVFGGFVGSLLGIGGGSLMTPLMIAVGIDTKVAVASSLLAIVGTSIGGLNIYMKEKLVDIRLALILEPLSTLGAITGVFLALRLNNIIIKILLFGILVYTAYSMIRKPRRENSEGLPAGSNIPTRRILAGGLLKYIAGLASALLGIGGGIVNIPIFRKVIGLNMKTSVATSKLLVGITASAGALGYYIAGVLDPCFAFSLSLGTISGAYLGSKVGVRTSNRTLQLLFSIVLIIIAVLMLVRR
ncbi:MAG: sulfite exporter TauE/SafE family protein [Desulfurococcales archaeon]|nr:sulfite exporter TauE/SafE family protein [Desulfurococcales archaeon]